MKQVANHAGVSIKTVSNYVNGYPHMSAPTRERIAASIKELGYRVNQSARSLRAGRTRTIGLLVPDVRQAYFPNLMTEIDEQAGRQGLSVAVMTTRGDPELERSFLLGDSGPDVDGIIFESAGLGADELPPAVTQRPLVIIGERVVGHESVDIISMDNEAAAHAAVHYLLSTGRRRILALGHRPSMGAPSASSTRLQGYRLAHEEAGVPVDEDLVPLCDVWSWEDGIAVTEQVMHKGVEFDAVFAFCDALALGVLVALQRAGKKIPEDVAVMGFDDIDEAAMTFPALSTVDGGRAWIADQAVTALLGQLNGEEREPKSMVAPFALRIRATT